MTSLKLLQLEIPRRNIICSQGQEKFAPGADYYSTLTEAISGEWQRQDYCHSCWEALSREDAKSTRGYWKSKVPLKQETVILSRNRNARALELLKERLACGAEEDREEIFVLALYLARARVIYLRQELQQDDGSWLNLYEVSATEEMLAVKKIDLSQLQIGKIQSQLAAQLVR